MRNQPKCNFFKNTSYAIQGIIDLLKTESSFNIEVVIVLILSPILIMLDLPLLSKIVMFITLFGMIIAETINSAIERAVDLVTLEHHEMAKRAKDVGSAIVFFSIFIFIITWILILLDNYYI